MPLDVCAAHKPLQVGCAHFYFQQHGTWAWKDGTRTHPQPVRGDDDSQQHLVNCSLFFRTTTRHRQEGSAVAFPANALPPPLASNLLPRALDLRANPLRGASAILSGARTQPPAPLRVTPSLPVVQRRPDHVRQRRLRLAVRC